MHIWHALGGLFKHYCDHLYRSSQFKVSTIQDIRNAFFKQFITNLVNWFECEESVIDRNLYMYIILVFFLRLLPLLDMKFV